MWFSSLAASKTISGRHNFVSESYIKALFRTPNIWYIVKTFAVYKDLFHAGGFTSKNL